MTMSSRIAGIKTAIHHFVSRCVLLLAIMIVLVAAALTIVRAATPLLSHNRNKIQHWIAELIHRPVIIGSIKAGWRGFEPVITMGNVTLFSSKNHQPAIKFDSLSLGLNFWRTIFTRHLQIGLVAVKGTALTVTESLNENRDKIITILANTGQTIAIINPNHKKEGHLLANLFAIDRVYINKVDITWHRLDGVIIPIHDIRMEVIKRKGVHEASGRASVKQNGATRFAFASHIEGTFQDPDSLFGTVYIYGQDINLKQWLPRQSFFGMDQIDGHLNGQLWMTWKNGGVQQVQTRITLTDFSAIAPELRSVKTISLPKIDANILWQHQKDGWLLTADNIHIRMPHLNYPTAQFSLQRSHSDSAQPGQSDHIKAQAHYEFFINYFPLQLVTPIIDYFNSNSPVNPRLYKAWRNYNPQGLLKNIYVDYQGKSRFAAHAQLQNLQLDRAGDIPAVKTLNGEFFVYPRYGSLTLESRDLTINEPAVFKNSIHLDKMVGELLWNHDGTGWNLYFSQLNFSNPDFNIYGKTQLFIPDKKKNNTTIALLMNADNIDMAKIKEYLPASVYRKKKLAHWLSTSFLGGKASHSILQIRGKLKDIPFDKKNGVFLSETTLQNVKLQYKPGWPSIENLNGTLIFNRRKMTANIDSGTLYQSHINKTIAVIADLEKKGGSKLDIQGTVDGPSSDGLRFLEESPLKKHIGRHLAGLKMDGPMHLNLELKIPLKHHADPEDVNVVAKGEVNIKGGTLKIPAWNIAFTHINGDLGFSNHTLFGRDINATFLNQPVSLNVTTLSQDASHAITQIELSGSIAMNDLYNQFPSALLKSLSGKTNYHAILQLRDHLIGANSLSIETQLLGVTVPYPKPFFKLASQPRQTEILIHFQDQMPVSSTIHYGKNVKAVLTLSKSKSQSKLNFLKGNVHLGPGLAKFQTKPGLIIDGTLPVVIWKEWEPWIIAKKQTTTHQNAKTSEDGFWQHHFRKLNLMLDKLSIFNHVFPKTRIEVRSFRQSSSKSFHKEWMIILNGPTIQGNISILNHQHPTVWARFTKVYLKKANKQPMIKSSTADVIPEIEKTTEIQTKNSIGSPLKPQTLPAINLQIDDFRMGNLILGKTVLKTTRTAEGLRINKFSANSHIFKLDATGFWQDRAGVIKSELKGEFDAASLGSILMQFDYPSVFDATNLQSHFNLKWSGAPYDLNLKTLQGSISFHTGPGRLIDMSDKANEGIATGQLLTFLSLQSLQRRLVFNFKDIKNKTFSFDSVKGDFRINNGDSWTNNTTINGVIARIDMHGYIGLIQKDFDLYMDITPHLTSSLPVIAAIAGGPIIGAATYIANKLFSPLVDKIAVRHYHLTGPWKKPKVIHLKK